MGEFPGKIHLQAGSRLYGAREGAVVALQPPRPPQPAKIVWSSPVSGEVTAMIAAGGKLVVATAEGAIYCFGGKATQPRKYARQTSPGVSPAAVPSERATAILRHTSVTKGYCLLFGLKTERLAEALARLSRFQIIGFDPSAAKVAALRRKLDAAGWYGAQVALQTGDLVSVQLPPYLANLIVVDEVEAGSRISQKTASGKLFRWLRPYGGVACLAVPATKDGEFAAWVRAEGLAGAELQRAGEDLLLIRKGALPGSADWTHQDGDVGNTLVAADGLVKGPLSVL